MIEVKPVDIDGNTVVGVKIGNPDFPEKPAIIVLIARKGLIVSRNFDIDALKKRNVTAAKVKSLKKLRCPRSEDRILHVKGSGARHCRRNDWKGSPHETSKMREGNRMLRGRRRLEELTECRYLSPSLREEPRIINSNILI